MGKWTRRAFIGAGALVGGGLVLGVAGAALAPARHGLRSDDAESAGELTTWILVTPDNFVTVLVPHCEMGQGAQTALAMMAAEELDAAWSQVRVEQAPADPAFANRYFIEGPVTLDNIGMLLSEGATFEGDSVIVDLARVTSADSSALSLLLEWMRRGNGRQIAFANVSHNLRSLAELYGVVDLIPVASE